MVNYECVKCTFSSKNRSNYERHLKSNKHLLINVNNSLNDLNCDIKTVNLNQDINTDHICIYCKRSFKLSRYLGKHLKVCIVKQYHDNEYEKKIKSLTEELTLCKTEHDHYKTESEYYKMLLENAGGMLKKSIGTLAYITNNFKNAPSIKKLDVKDIDSEDIKNSDNFIKVK